MQGRCVPRVAAIQREHSTPTGEWARLEKRDPSNAQPCRTFSARCTMDKHPAVCTKTPRVFPCGKWSTERAKSRARGCRKPGRRATRVRRSAVAAVRSAAPWRVRRCPHSRTSEPRAKHESTWMLFWHLANRWRAAASRRLRNGANGCGTERLRSGVARNCPHVTEMLAAISRVAFALPTLKRDGQTPVEYP
jgi:hypothetical protein